MIKRLIMWFKYRKHPCYVGNGEFDHDLEFIDESFDHEYGTETIHYMQCSACGQTGDVDD